MITKILWVQGNNNNNSSLAVKLKLLFGFGKIRMMFREN